MCSKFLRKIPCDHIKMRRLNAHHFAKRTEKPIGIKVGVSGAKNNRLEYEIFLEEYNRSHYRDSHQCTDDMPSQSLKMFKKRHLFFSLHFYDLIDIYLV